MEPATTTGVKLKELVSFIRGVSYKKAQASKEKRDSFTAVLRANNLNDGKFNFDELVFVPSDLVSPQQMIATGDIVITMSSGSKAHVGKVAIATQDIHAAFGAFCGKIVPEKIRPKYLFYALRNPNFRRHIELSSKGTNINNLKQNCILDYEIQLPPLPEQKRIVAKIEELFSELDHGVETLEKTKQQLAVYRQAVLKSILESHCQDAKVVQIRDVCFDVKVGIVIKPTRYYVQNGGVRAFRNANVRRNYIQDDDWALISQEGHRQNSRSIVHTGNVLIARSGVNLGMAAAIPEQFDGYNAIDVVIAVPKQDIILPKYLAYYTNSPYGISSVKSNQRGVGQGHLNVTVYAKLPLMLPSIKLQAMIIDEIESRLSVCDGIEKTVDTALRQAEAMRQGILKKAFEGGL